MAATSGNIHDVTGEGAAPAYTFIVAEQLKSINHRPTIRYPPWMASGLVRESFLATLAFYLKVRLSNLESFFIC